MDIGALGVYAVLFLALYFEIFLLVSFIEKRPSGKSAERPSHYPTVSVIVPCFNEERTVGMTIESLLALDYPHEKLSILVVDDGSKDGTRAIAEDFAKKNRRVSVLSKENGGKYTALNLGIERSKSD